jgi:DNA polymerase-3 subunit delta
MAELKAHEVDRWLAQARQPVPVMLVYGPDRGLVSERARRLAEVSGVALDDPFSTVRLDAADVDRDPGRLVDEAGTISMFSDKRLLWVRGALGQKGLAEQVKAICASPPQDAVLLIEAGDLKKGSALRSAVETSPAGITLPCYADDRRSLDALIDTEMRAAGLAIDDDARQALHTLLGGDRLATRQELQKIALYAHGAQRVGLGDVRDLAGDVSGVSADDAVDAMLAGNVTALDRLLRRQGDSGQGAYPLLAAAMRTLQTLQLLRAAMDRDGKSPAAAVAGAKPRVFFSRQKLFEQALTRWTEAGLATALERLQATVLDMRRRPELAASLVRLVMLGLAARSAQRRG